MYNQAVRSENREGDRYVQGGMDGWMDRWVGGVYRDGRMDVWRDGVTINN